MRRVATVVIAAALLLVSGASALAAQESPGDADPGFVRVLEVSGLFDPVMADFVIGALADAENDGALGVVLQINSKGAVIADADLVALADRIEASSVPVYLWIGPSGSGLRGGTAQLAAVAAATGISPGSRFGDLGPAVLDDDLLSAHFGDQLARMRANTLSASEAIAAGLATDAPILGFFLVNDIDGFQSRQVTGPDGTVTREPVSITTFVGLSLLDQLFHTMASPAVAYLLLLSGLGLLVFELYTAGVGVAGVVGAFCFLGGCYGLDVVPARGWAVALLFVAFFAFAVDIQTGVARLWTGIGTAALIVGSVALFEQFDFSWITLGAGIVLTLLAMVSGMPAMVRTRFSTPTIGREWMIGQMGEAVDAVDPDGRVKVLDALWEARTNRATPIAAGEAVRVIGIEGLFLEVEPQHGAARDYRDRSPRD